MTKYNRLIPYNNLPDLPPKAQLESPQVLKKIIGASRLLAQLNGAIVHLPNPYLFIDSLHLQEAKASSAIENIITTNDELYQSLMAEKRYDSPEAKEVLKYKEALWYGFAELEKKPFITTNLCISLMQKIKQNTSGIRNVPGTVLSNTKGEVIYTPPTGEAVIRKKLASWESFINNHNELDPLVKMALMHYQFEAIHPFADGNGRTGRILLLLFLKLEKLLDVPAIYLSEYIITHKQEYYEKLRGVTENTEWEGWILYLLDMIELTAASGLKRLQAMQQLLDSTSQAIKTALPKIHSKELMETLFRLPYTKRQVLIDAGLGTPKTVGNYLMQLETEGFLRSIKVGKEKLYINQALMNCIEAKY